jgi:hypothetical protein
MNEYIIFYEHTEYGYYTSVVEHKSIHKALKHFRKKHAHKAIYGIMEKYKSPLN